MTQELSRLSPFSDMTTGLNALREALELKKYSPCSVVVHPSSTEFQLKIEP